MSRDELIFLCILLISLPVGHVVKQLRSPLLKQWICTLAGITLVLATCQLHILHSAVTTLGTCALIKISGYRHCHKTVFAYCFGYLLFFRMCTYFGLPSPPAVSNALQLILTLKMVGVAFEIHDSLSIKQLLKEGHDEKSLDHRKMVTMVISEPATLDLVHYAYCHIGLFTGPFFRYKTYYDMVHNPQTREIPSLEPMLHRTKLVVMFGALFLWTSNYVTLEYVQSQEFYGEGLPWRAFYMVLVFFVFRMRMYSAWILSECTCMAATLGAYPAHTLPRCGLGPTATSPHPPDHPKSSSTESAAVEYNYETVHNIDAYGCDFTPTFRDAMRCWNRSVQWWLATYIYKRVDSHQWRTTVTMLVSAFWHGIHSGYYLSFLTVPFFLLAEDVMIRSFRTEQNQVAFDRLNWFFRMRGFEYLSMGFLLLGVESTLRYWHSIYFICHLLGLVFIIVGFCSSYTSRKKNKHSQ